MTIPALPYSTPPSRDLEHIKLLAIFTYVWGGLAAAFSLFGLIYIFIGIMFLKGGNAMAPTTNPAGLPTGPPPELMGWIFICVGSIVPLLGWTIAGLNFYSARSMQKQKRRTLSLVVAGLNCLSVPFGTVLGIFTFIVLSRDTVVQIYRTPPDQNAV